MKRNKITADIITSFCIGITRNCLYKKIHDTTRRQRQITDTFIRHKRADFAQKDVTLRRINLKFRIWK